jgi:uncharacterized protein DUF3325
MLSPAGIILMRRSLSYRSANKNTEEQSMVSIALGLICLGCVLLSLSLGRHYRQVFADPATFEPRRWPLRVTGYGILLLGLWPCVRALGLWVGLILWLSMLALAAFLQIMVLTYRPHGSAVIGGLGVALVALGFLL